MSILRTALTAGLFAAVAGAAFAADNDPVIVSGSDDPVIVSGIEARVVQPILAPQGSQWTKKYGPVGGYYPEMAARERIIPGQAALECDLAVDGKLSACKILSETPARYGFGDASLKMAAKGVLTAAPQKEASERVRMVVAFAPPAKK